MVDYTKSTGSSGTMLIRDTGTTVEFWITAGNPTTFHHDLPWRYTINGNTSSWKEYNYNAGSGYEKLGEWNITYTQTVTFYLGATGTSGFGGPTTFSKQISRASAPDAPSIVTLSNITHNSMRGTFTAGDNNGAPIDQYIIGYGTNSSEPTQNINVGSDRTHDFTGLSQGTTYYFWARTHNSKGWSPRGPRASAKTLSVPSAPSAPVLSEVTQSSVRVSFTPNSNGGSAITSYSIGYGTSSGSPSSFVSTGLSTNFVVDGLTPGTRYYFWTRATNAIGNSALSASRNAKTIAGARIKVGGVWVNAIPYVKDDGEWKVAVPWVRYAGIWKETS